ncbi:MAG: ABC transporter ATP-binding protein [Candidatus Kariarchaeaceae archaeon]|jgi:putative ABC transport system ATP-binding protein
MSKAKKQVSILDVHDITKVFDMKAFKVQALENITFHVQKGEFIGLIGPSGSGKTTLINILSGILQATSGEVLINNHNVTKLHNSELRDFRLKNIGLVFQEHLLVESLTARENIELPLIFAKVSPEERKTKALKLLNQLGLEGKGDHLPAELSGGEQQRVGIARALIFDPLLILADEPTGDLDTKTGASIIRNFKNITMMGTSIIMVSHDPRHRPHFDRVLQMNDGKLEPINEP